MFAIERLRKQVVPGSTRHLISTGALVACLLTVSLVGCAEAKATPNAKACETLNREAYVDSGSKALAGSLKSVQASEGITSELSAKAAFFWIISKQWQEAQDDFVIDRNFSGEAQRLFQQDVEKRDFGQPLAATAKEIAVLCSTDGVAVTGYIKEQSDAYDEVFNEG